MSYFPMYVQMTDKKCVVIGGKSSAYRKIKIMQEFGAKITVIAPQVLDKIQELSEISWKRREFEEEDLDDVDLVIVATEDEEFNRKISAQCQERKIPVNVVDQMENCTFIFPSYIKKGEVVAAFSSGGKSPVITQYLKREMEPVMTEHLGEMAECLGRLRAHVRACVDTEAARKKVYEDILELGLTANAVPSTMEIVKVIEKYKKR